MRPLVRPWITAKSLPAAAYKTYEISSPRETHTRPATCLEFGCERLAKGWVTVLDTSKVNHAKTANWIRLFSKRRFTYTQAGSIVTFTFPPGQNCFTPHRVTLERPELFLVKGGDWRGNPTQMPTVVHTVDNWLDDFANHQDMIATKQQRG